MLRVSQWFTENEEKFIGMDDYTIDSMIDDLPYYSEYDYFNHNDKNYMRIVADREMYEWVFDKNYICIACYTYEEDDTDTNDIWDETLCEIETWEWYKNRI